MTKIEATNKKRIFSGIVVSDKMDKTLVVKVERVKLHSKYGKQYLVSKKFHVHDENNKYKVNDKVKFIECRPFGGNKKWKVI